MIITYKNKEKQSSKCLQDFKFLGQIFPLIVTRVKIFLETTYMVCMRGSACGKAVILLIAQSKEMTKCGVFSVSVYEWWYRNISSDIFYIVRFYNARSNRRINLHPCNKKQHVKPLKF